MAFTRKFLKALGLTEEQVDSVVEAHTETVDGLKSQMAGYKADAEKLEDVQKKLDDLKAKGGGEVQTRPERQRIGGTGRAAVPGAA